MFTKNRRFAVRIILILTLLLGAHGFPPTPAIAQSTDGSIATSEIVDSQSPDTRLSDSPLGQSNEQTDEDDCSGVMWTNGPLEPEVASQVEIELTQTGMAVTVEARGYGETDSCGAYTQYGIDFTVNLADLNPANPSVQQALTNDILPVLLEYGKPNLGNVRFVSSQGEIFQVAMQAEAPALLQTDDDPLPSDAIHKNVYVIVYDPLLGNGQTLSEYKNWYDHATITQQTIDFFKNASNNKLNYSVVDTTIVTSGWPELMDGFTYTEAEYLAVLTDPNLHHTPTEVNYNKILSDPAFDICGRLNRGEIDEVWIYNGPWFGFYESRLVGPGSYYLNSTPATGIHNCNKIIPIMGPSVERAVDEAIHNFTHRAEATMTKVYGSWQQNRTAHSWDKFGLVKAQSPSYTYGGCGSSHYPSNGTSDYNYNNPASVLSNCDDFANYPNLSDPLQVAQSVTCSAWGCTGLGYYEYWFNHFPSFPECGPDTVANDWWKFIADPGAALYASTVCQADARSVSGNSGTGLADIQYVDGILKTATTDVYGNYFFIVPNQWSGTAAPVMADHTFIPVNRTYSNIQASQYEQDYTSEISCPENTVWQGEYWTNYAFLGAPAVCRSDTNLDFQWGMSSPAPIIPIDSFSARWTRTVQFTGGAYRFYMSNDDGARLFVDDVLQLDAWDNCCSWRQVDVTLSAGDHDLRMEMFENSGGSAAQLWWETLGAYNAEIDTKGNDVSITDEDNTPSPTDHTDFGTVLVPTGSISRTFTIYNIGESTLNLPGSPIVSVLGSHASDFTVTAQPANQIRPAGSSTFTVVFDPSAVGLRTATISIATNDQNENPFNFSVQGTGFDYPRVVSIDRANPDPTSASGVDFNVTFSDSVTGVDISDFDLTTTGLTGASLLTVSGSGVNYIVSADTGNGDGTIRLDLMDDNSIQNPSGDLLGGPSLGDGNFTTGETYTVDKSSCFTVTASIVPVGSGAVNATAQNCAGGYRAGTDVQLTAVPNTDYAFVNWSGDATGTSNPISITINGNKNVTANFSNQNAELVGYWKFDASSGTTAIDSSTYGNNGTVSGAAWTTGKVNNGLSFDGVNDYVQVPNSSSLSLGTNQVTFAAWLYPTSISSGWTTVAQRSNSNGSWFDWQLYSRASDAPTPNHPVLRVDWNQNGSMEANEQVQGDIILQANTWYYIAATYDGTAMKFYINGTLRGTTNISGGNIPASNKPIWIGGNDAWGEHFPGRIDEFRIYNRALSETEIQAIMNPPVCYALTLSHTGQGSDPLASPVNSTGCPNGQYAAGATINLSGAVPSTGWQIGGWAGTDNNSNTASANTVTMPASAHTASVNYAQIEYNLTVNVVGSGTVTKSPDQAAYHYGDVVQLTATPDIGWTFASWSGDITGTTNPASITINGDRSVTATFTQNQYTLSVTSTHGTVTKNPDKATYTYGEAVQLTAAPGTGWNFVNWTGDVTGSSNPVSITMDGNKAVAANYVETGPPVVTKTADTNDGVCDSDCSLREAIFAAQPGDTINFNTSLVGQTITLASDLILDKDVTIDGSGLSPQVTISGGDVAHIEIDVNTTVTISGLTIADGHTSSSGGAITNGGYLTIIDSTLRNNYSGNSCGAIQSYGPLTLRNSTIHQNYAVGNGGAICLYYTGNTLVNSTITQNRAGSSGGALYILGSAEAEIHNSTFAMNNATSGGSEVFSSGASDLSANNTIFACSTDTIEACIGYLPLTGIGNIVTTDSLTNLGIAELADNGGPTKTMALYGDSTLINAGDDAICANAQVNNSDQRGRSRSQGAHCDIGAYEDQLSVLYVDQNATGADNGSSWTNAYTDLQSALSAAASDDEIWVAAGTYKPTSGADRTVSFILKNGVAVYGGFTGTETLRSQRDFEVNITVLSGDIGIIGDISDNSYHVVVGSGTNNSALLDGFTITAGNANGDINPSNNGRGGGMFNDRGSPSINNVIFSGNSANLGGGLYNYNSQVTHPYSGSNPILTDVTFVNNSAVEGGGMENSDYSSPTLINVTFSGNTADRGGGGLLNLNYCSPSLTDVTFSGNSADWGGGMGNWSGSHPSLTNVTFSNNLAEWGAGMGNDRSNPTLTNVIFTNNTAVSSTANPPSGGGMFNTASSPNLTNVTFSGNSAEFGGGIFLQSASSPILVNVTFSGNSAVYGSVILSRDVDSSPTLTNVTISGNSASVGGGTFANAGSPVIRNSILWGNTGGEIVNVNLGVPIVTNSIVQGGYPGTGNLDADPLLGTLQNNGGFSQTMAPLPGSAAIDAGDDSVCPATDQRGVARPQGSHCDIGAHEVNTLTLISPTGTYNNWDHTFKWIGKSDATWYLLEIQTASSTQVFRKWYTSTQTGCPGGTNCSITPTDLNLPNGDYKWRIMDYGAYGYGVNTPFLTFTLNAACYTLTTDVNPSGVGAITTPAQTCTGGYTAGSIVQLTAAPDSGYLFENWSGDAAGTSNPVSVTMNGNKSVTANFKAALAPLSPFGALTSWDKSFTWTGLTDATWYLVEVQTSTGTQVFRKWYTSAQAGCSGGTNCSVTASEINLPNGDYKWRIMDYGAYGYGSNTSFLNFTLNLTFACHTLTTSVSPGASGVINLPPQTCDGGYTSGTGVQLTVVPNTGYTFTGWSGDANGSANPLTIIMDGNKTVTANLRGNTPISPSDTLTAWDKAFAWTGLTDATWYLIEVQTSTGTQVFRKWYTSAQTNCTGGTNCSVTASEISLENGDYKWRVMDYGAYGYGINSAFKAFTLDLTPACHTLTIDLNPGASGSVNAAPQNCTGGYTTGTLVQLTAVPNTGYLFKDWSGDASSTTNPISITMDGDKSITANFKAITVLLSPSGTLNTWENTFTWTGIPDATWYLLEIYTPDGTQVFRKWYTSPQTNCSGGTACSITPPETAGLANGNYKWRILDYGAYGYGIWTPYTNFTLDQ